VLRSITHGWVKLFMIDIDGFEVDRITRKFFQLHYNSVDIVSKILQDDIWIVKVFLFSFGQNLSRVLSIESKTGRILNCE